MAQAPVPIGVVGQVDGLVTMSIGSQVATVQPGTPIFEGARFVSSSGASVQLNLPNCTVPLGPNQAVTIQPGADCSTQIAGITTVVPATAVAGGSGPLIPLLTIAALTGVVKKVQESDSVSEQAISPTPP